MRDWIHLKIAKHTHVICRENLFYENPLGLNMLHHKNPVLIIEFRDFPIV